MLRTGGLWTDADLQKRRDARERFATANGWKVTEPFTLDLLIKKQHHHRDGYAGNPAGYADRIDHPEYYRVGRYPVAILGHNYHELHTHALLNKWAVELERDLALHLPPAGPAASWWYPGVTLPFALTRPDILHVTWPTEQEMAAMAKWRR